MASRRGRAGSPIPLDVRSHIAGSPAGGWDVAFRGVIHHHAIGVEPPAEGADGTLHAFDPAAGQTVVIALVVERDHFFAKGAHQVFSVSGIVNGHAGVSSASSDGEA